MRTVKPYAQSFWLRAHHAPEYEAHVRLQNADSAVFENCLTFLYSSSEQKSHILILGTGASCSAPTVSSWYLNIYRAQK
jgi:hypothetical protein